jgi:hypothetical protein
MECEASAYLGALSGFPFVSGINLKDAEDALGSAIVG